jgi:hypothetical protein
MRKPTSRLVQSLNNRSTPALAYPLTKVTATVRNYQPFCEINEGDHDDHRHRATPRGSTDVVCHLKFFSETIKLSSSSSGTLSHGASPYLRLQQPNALFVQAARFLLLGIISSIISKRQRKTVIAGERAHNHEARSTSAQIAEGPSNDGRPHQRAGTGERHEAQPIQCSARGSALWVQNVLLPTEGNGKLKLYNAFTEHQRQFLTEKDGTIALAAFHEFCTIIAAQFPNDDSFTKPATSNFPPCRFCRKQASSSN